MQTVTVNLFKAADAEDSFAIQLPGDAADHFRAQRGFGAEFVECWAIEFQSETEPDRWHTDWNQVLNRAVEAYTMHDPVITNYHWPAVGVEV